ncbi:hypothetical protein GJ744_008894 [Endocarpon pusillum]|uniref:Elongator complex protein 2 n=1 Tax=Endocarpon pusillum TaxID=364733 RepID=A0A8H7AQH2_9EURO|nr:hypothetical protein GJ744_008894 [Endocarpon pusillum]
MIPPSFDYISAGGNRHPSAADWDQWSGVLAFGADQNVALWNPLGADGRGIYEILVGHEGQINAIKFAQQMSDGTRRLLSGSADGELCVWQRNSHGNLPDQWVLLSKLKAHKGAINTIATLPGSQLVATGGADSTIKIWRLPAGDTNDALVHTIELKPSYIPLTVAIGDFMVEDQTDSVFVAVGGTRTSIQVYAVSGLAAGKATHCLQVTISGHESWVTSLALKSIREHGPSPDKALWLASASQDKSVRLWLISRNRHDNHGCPPKHELLLEQSLAAKVHTIRAASITLSITFEALLLGHEDWIYTAFWNPQPGTRQLLTASADNSLIVWEPEPSSGIWLSSTRLGEISGQKGATSATGSTGGFWIGLWSPNADAVACLGKTGSWRLWQHHTNRSYWVQKAGLSGHTKIVTDLSWTRKGEYLLSTSSDQTTRLHAEWQSSDSRSWHEFARPQIHGYDLNCIQSLSTTRFVSGADEKLLRVFKQPKKVANMLERLCGIASSEEADVVPEAADMPVLGLSNKATTQNIGDGADFDVDDNVAGPTTSAVYESEEPPTEDHLARHTLWPEQEKLYGHGHEISALAANHAGSLIATACKASSTEHAVIRMYDTEDWHEIRPPLAAHSLTITALAFEMNGDQLLSVGRDRQWTVFVPITPRGVLATDGHASPNYALSAANPKGHTRMILDAAWCVKSTWPVFATAGRDKTVKIWASLDDKNQQFTCRTNIVREAAVTAIDFYNNSAGNLACLAVGEETGQLSYHVIPVDAYKSSHGEQVEPLRSVEIVKRLCPSKAITRLAWRPRDLGRLGIGAPSQLAVASADSSLRILSIDWERSEGT